MNIQSQPSENKDASLSIEVYQTQIAQLKAIQAELKAQNHQLREAGDEHLASQSRYFDLYDQAPVGYCTLNDTGQILEANHTACTLLGAAWGGLTQWPINRFIRQENLPLYSTLNQQLFETGKPQEFELQMLKMDGTPFWAHLKTTAVQLPDGTPGAHLILNDISERKQMEETLRESESNYKTLFETAADGILIANLETQQFLFANPAMCRMLNYSEKELLELHVSDVHPADSVPHIVRQFEAQGRGEIFLVQDVPCQRKDGSTFPVDINTNCFTIHGEACNIGIFRDISERKQTETKLKESEKKFRLFFESADDAIYIHDENGQILDANPLACEQLGYSREELLSMTARQVDAPEEALYIQKRIDQLKQQGHLTVESLHQRKEGSTLPVEIKARLIQWNDQPAVISVCRDLTERKRAEVELKESEKKFKQLFETMEEGVFYQQANGNLIDVNAAALRMFGLTREEALSRSSDHKEWNVIRKDGTPIPPTEHPSILALSAGKVVQDVVGVMSPQTKNYTWVAVSCVPEFLDGETAPHQVAVTMHELTERESAEFNAV